MPIQVLMPALSPTMEKGNLSKWLKKEGEAIKSGDVIAEIETDKATMEVEATDEGTLGKILIPEGTADVAVNTPIATILADGETDIDVVEIGTDARVEAGNEIIGPDTAHGDLGHRREIAADAQIGNERRQVVGFGDPAGSEPVRADHGGRNRHILEALVAALRGDDDIARRLVR